jgi:ABC-2 type transporter
MKIVSLLQPPPETFALFDELVLLSAGHVIYSGPVEKVVPYFEALGYELPDRMDVADWLQVKYPMKLATLLQQKSQFHVLILFLLRHCLPKMDHITYG